MRRVVIPKPGGYERLCIEDAPDLMAAPGQVVVDVAFAGVNYADIAVRWGIYESAKRLVGWPITPGFEFAGTVREVGRDVIGIAVGDRVLGMTLFNGYASQVVVPAYQIYPLPSELSLAEAAGFPAVFLTAYHALFQNVVIRPGATVLVHSAAGGVGGALLQLCRLQEFRTIAVVGATHKVAAALTAGADAVIDKSQMSLWREIERLAPEGCDVILDANGVATLKGSYRHLAPTGKLIVYGFHTMLPKYGGHLNYAKLAWNFLKTPRFSPFHMTTENKSVIAFNLSFLFHRRDLLHEGMDRLLGWVRAGRIKPPLVTEYRLEDVASAHKALESGQTVGKLVLRTA